MTASRMKHQFTSHGWIRLHRKYTVVSREAESSSSAFFWGQGIQKIRDECTALGAELPKYEIIGTGLRVYYSIK